MGSPRLIKKRVSSIKNIRKITKALEMVSASKVQRTQERALNAKPFAQKVYELVQSFTLEVNPREIPLLRIPVEVKTTLFVLISSNRGLAGSLNTNLLRFLEAFIKKNPRPNYAFITVGKKGRNFALRNGNLLADFSDNFRVESGIASLVKAIVDNFTTFAVDEVFLVYNDFVSVLSQEPSIKKILPIISKEMAPLEKPAADVKPRKYSFEPSAEAVLSRLLPFYLEVQVSEVIFEAEASEHAARMVAMRNASDNALELSLALILEFNKARQQAITSEINDIVTAGVSLSQNA